MPLSAPGIRTQRGRLGPLAKSFIVFPGVSAGSTPTCQASFIMSKRWNVQQQRVPAVATSQQDIIKIVFSMGIAPRR